MEIHKKWPNGLIAGALSRGRFRSRAFEKKAVWVNPPTLSGVLCESRLMLSKFDGEADQKFA
jgi:hypothetical protein